MNDTATGLEHECRVFTRYITCLEATPYVIEKYRAAHATVLQHTPDDPFSQRLLDIAGHSPLATRIADAYARLLAPRCQLRRKLILLLAILETAEPYCHGIDNTPPRSLLAAMLNLCITGTAGTLAALTGVLVFTPLRIATHMRRDSA